MEPDPPTHEPGPLEILLVEANAKDAQLTLRAPSTHRLTNHVRVASDSEEALEILRRNGRPRVILLDLVGLPKMSGLDLLARVKADVAMRHIPVVVLTSSMSEKDLEECYRLGANSYLAKPVAFDEFMRMTETLGLYWVLMNKLPPAPPPPPPPPRAPPAPPPPDGQEP